MWRVVAVKEGILFDDQPSGKETTIGRITSPCRFQRHLNDAGIVGQGRPPFTDETHVYR